MMGEGKGMLLYNVYEKCVAQYHLWSKFLKMIAIIITLLGGPVV